MTVDDEYDICETVYRFAYGVDTRDWALYRSIFADEIHVDYSSYGGYAPTVQLGDAWVADIAPLFMGSPPHSTRCPTRWSTSMATGAHCRMYV